MASILSIVPSSAPSNLIVSSITSTGVVFSWSNLPLSSQNGIITGYIVNLVEISSGNAWNYTSNTTSLSLLAVLSPHTAYKFTIAAQTVIGNGPFSASSIFTSHEDCKPFLLITVMMLKSEIFISSTSFQP